MTCELSEIFTRFCKQLTPKFATNDAESSRKPMKSVCSVTCCHSKVSPGTMATMVLRFFYDSFTILLRLFRCVLRLFYDCLRLFYDCLRLFYDCLGVFYDCFTMATTHDGSMKRRRRQVECTRFYVNMMRNSLNLSIVCILTIVTRKNDRVFT